MKISCNGCRILRKGCTEDCVIRPCLEWINSSEAQANATLFLSKFYGRAGLLNLINAAPQQHRTDVFKSLMYEACGRIINPTFGSVGLFWSGEWAQCQAAVDAVLAGSQINVMPTSHSQSDHGSKLLDIRHVSKDANMDKVRGKSKKHKDVMMPMSHVGLVNSATLWNPILSHEPRRLEGGNGEIMKAVLVSQDKPRINGGANIDLELTLG
ncbi:hypothetical protein LR48_Vigan06g110400 [Vigna angularis]|uniref:LOB domain-containing protein n=2 Tax=Phaseolus angularis TaxID=3914 RepID=A0A0L9USS1_PHAAN|nr:LOB domain-containing protein 41 [Vigna angularis]KAG2376862.1 LOB domain-containing protein [Vigna angularis]KOM45798.1 hypothetical protein LR48_Vigan06g110400 [Vigna angularis]BAT99201.1 hypothetical protein VIGAN_10059800 [Vigna angularis var. angularis]